MFLKTKKKGVGSMFFFIALLSISCIFIRPVECGKCEGRGHVKYMRQHADWKKDCIHGELKSKVVAREKREEAQKETSFISNFLNSFTFSSTMGPPESENKQVMVEEAKEPVKAVSADEEIEEEDTNLSQIVDSFMWKLGSVHDVLVDMKAQLGLSDETINITEEDKKKLQEMKMQHGNRENKTESINPNPVIEPSPHTFTQSTLKDFTGPELALPTVSPTDTLSNNPTTAPTNFPSAIPPSGSPTPAPSDGILPLFKSFNEQFGLIKTNMEEFKDELVVVQDIATEEKQLGDAKEKSSCNDDFIYYEMSKDTQYNDHFPVNEYVSFIDIGATDNDVDACPDFLCNKDYASNRMVLFYYPDEDAKQFTKAYVNFATSLMSVFIETSNGEQSFEFYALSCCANVDFCNYAGIEEYPSFKLMVQGDDVLSGFNAVFSKESIVGPNAFHAVQGVFNLIMEESGEGRK